MVVVKEIGYLVFVWFLYVLGGCVMEIVYKEEELFYYMEYVVKVYVDYFVLIDCYLIGKEIEVDVILDGEIVVILGIMEYVECVGVYLGDFIVVYLL